ncbi:MAG TPA: hypothetical protein VEP73_04430 [Actinomycetota bacterium]|nr:hypothetical protein [Actinomycetota bacterium]
MRLVRTVAIVATVAALTVAFAVAPASAQTVPTLVAVRTGHHPGFDRVVFELRGGRPSAQVRYVRQLTEDASGKPVSLAGSANLLVVFHGVNAHDDSGQPTVSPRRFSPNLPNLKEVAQIGDFEAVVSYGLGLDHRVPVRVFNLSSPSRVVIDIPTGGQAQATAGQGGTLPFTGSNDAALLVTGIAMLLAGGIALVLGRITRTP